MASLVAHSLNCEQAGFELNLCSKESSFLLIIYLKLAGAEIDFETFLPVS